jgi:ATP-dependent exoDNAse (exonuclease V) beta subunit
MRNSILEKLKKFEDPLFKFDPIKHCYTYDGEVFISVTKYKERFYKKFEEVFWSKKTAEKKGVSQDEILLEWKQLAERSQVIGNGIHNWIENYFNGILQKIPNDLDIVDRINKFNILYAEHLHKLEPIRFEQRIFSKKWKLAGMIDSIFVWNDKIFILDWKSNKVYTTDDSEKGKFEKLLSPFGEFYKNHLNEYSIQVSLYRLILKEVGIDIKTCYLVHIGPTEPAKIYKAHDFTDLLEEYLNNTIS